MVLRVEDTDAERSRPELVDAIYESLGWLGIDWDGEPVHQSDRTELYVDAAQRLLAAGWPIAATAPAPTSTPATRRGGAQDPRLRRVLPRPRGGRRARRGGAVPRPRPRARPPSTDLIRGEVTFEQRQPRGLRASSAAVACPMFLLANAVDDADHGDHPHHPGRGPDQHHAQGAAAARGAGHRLPAPVRARAADREREAPEAVQAARRRVGGRLPSTAATCPRRWSTTWPRWAGAPPDGVEIRPAGRDRGAVRDRRRHLVARLLRPQEARPLRRRVHPGAVRRRVHRPRPSPGSPASGASRPGPRPTTTRPPSPPWRRWCRSGSTRLDQVPGYVDFLFRPEPDVDQAAWDKVMVKGGDAAAAMLDAVADAYRTCDWDARRAHGGDPGRGRAAGAAQEAVAGADPGGGHRPVGRARRSGSRWSCSVASARWTGCGRPDEQLIRERL